MAARVCVRWRRVITLTHLGGIGWYMEDILLRKILREDERNRWQIDTDSMHHSRGLD